MHILFCYSMSYFGKLTVCFIIRMHLLSFFHIFKTSTSCCSRFGGLKLSGSRGRNN